VIIENYFILDCSAAECVAKRSSRDMELLEILSVYSWTSSVAKSIFKKELLTLSCSSPLGNVSAVSSNIDDKTIHELYLWPFADAVHAGAGCIMCSYNRLNNSYSCQNSKMLNGLLKTELGFEGFVVSDWGAQRISPLVTC